MDEPQYLSRLLLVVASQAIGEALADRREHRIDQTDDDEEAEAVDEQHWLLMNGSDKRTHPRCQRERQANAP